MIFCGGATNSSALYKGFGMMQSKRLGLRVLVATDMAFTYTGNGFDEHTARPDDSLSPDSGERRVNAWIERHFDGTFQSDHILAHDPRFAYTVRVSQEEGLVSYWRLDAPSGSTHTQDLSRVQGAWSLRSRSRPGVKFAVPGAIAGDGDTAAQFDGGNALLVSPMFRADTPPGSPLLSLSSRSFTLEAWVQPFGLEGPQTILSHDDGTDADCDFLLMIGVAAGAPRFRFVTRGFANDLVAATPLHPEQIREEEWFHVVAVQDLGDAEVRLFVNGRLEASAALRGEARSVSSSLQIGSRGHPNLADGEAGEANSGEVLDPGFALFRGRIDEVGIYERVLTASSVREHYQLGTGLETGVDRGPRRELAAPDVPGSGRLHPAPPRPRQHGPQGR